MRKTFVITAAVALALAAYLVGDRLVRGDADAKPAEQACAQVIGLTFDDGPTAGTPETLDVLRRHGVRASFFVQGDRAAATPDVVRRIAAEAHEVGNHSYTHPSLVALTPQAAAVEIGRTQAAVTAATGKAPKLARAPYGLTNNALLATYAAYGLTHVMWNDQALDWENPPADVIVRRILDGARPGGIILLHEEHANTRAALPRIIQGLRDGGFCFGKVAPAGRYDPNLRSSVTVARW